MRRAACGVRLLRIKTRQGVGRLRLAVEASPDVICDSLPGLHFEVKRTERLNAYAALDQARDDAGEGQTPVVAHRRSGCRWIAILDLHDLLAILRESSLVESEAA